MCKAEDNGVCLLNDEPCDKCDNATEAILEFYNDLEDEILDSDEDVW